jgi:hypothetical protein
MSGVGENEMGLLRFFVACNLGLKLGKITWPINQTHGNKDRERDKPIET